MFSFVSTPIGNLGDITLRALEELKNADIIYCEDTRHSLKLLNHFGISKKLESFHDYSRSGKLDRILELLNEGKHLCYISDAGTPMISDPGYEIAVFLEKNGHPFEVIPGVNAAIPALMLSVFPCDRFFFGGFLPKKETDLISTFEKAAKINVSSVFYQSPLRIKKTLEILDNSLPDRECCVVKEITKLYQQSVKGLPGDLKKRFTSKEKGEFVIILSPEKEHQQAIDDTSLKEEYTLLRECSVSHKSAVSFIAKKYSVSGKSLYKSALEWEKETS